MNDYRQYGDYLMHYGVKGMKWDHHIYAQPEEQRRQRGKRPTVSSDGQTSTGGTGSTRLDKFVAEAEANANNAQKVGNDIESLIGNGDFKGAYDAYMNADPGAKTVINDYVMNNYVFKALGGGDKKLGRQRVRQGAKIADWLMNGPLGRSSEKLYNAVSTRTEFLANPNLNMQNLRQGHRKNM